MSALPRDGKTPRAKSEGLCGRVSASNLRKEVQEHFRQHFLCYT